MGLVLGLGLVMAKQFEDQGLGPSGQEFEGV